MYFLDLDCSLQEWWSADASSCAGTRIWSGESELVDAMLEQLTAFFPLQYIRTVHLHRLVGACAISRPFEHVQEEMVMIGRISSYTHLLKPAQQEHGSAPPSLTRDLLLAADSDERLQHHIKWSTGSLFGGK